MTVIRVFVLAAFVSFALGAAAPAVAFIASRIMLRRHKFALADDTTEIGTNLGLWFIAVGCTCMAFALWRGCN